MSARLKWLLVGTVVVAVATLAVFVFLPARQDAGRAVAVTPPVASAAPAQPVPVATGGKLALAVTENGFEPSLAKVQGGAPLTLEITRKTDATCATAIVIPDYGIQRDLPLGQTVAVTFTPKKSGELHYGCAHGQMISGVLVVE